MQPLQYWLGRQGFDARLWCYPSLQVPTSDLAKKLAMHLDRMDCESIPYHIVAHSLGCIVTRAALMNSNHSGLKRIVFLAPPILGTPLGRLAPGFLKQWFPPLLDLSDANDSFVNLLPRSMPVETGIVSARFDVLVPMKNTLLSDDCPHIVVNGTHNSILASPKVAELVANFLKLGRFESYRSSNGRINARFRRGQTRPH